MTVQNAAASLMKACDGCTLCCSVYDIPELEKKAGCDCSHISRHGGCGLWGIHPKTCQDFKCLWLKHSGLDARWRPDVCGFVLRVDEDGRTLWLDVDYRRPAHWRDAPYYAQIKDWSKAFKRGEGMVFVSGPEGVWVITPEEDLLLKNAPKGALIEAGYERTLFGVRPFARVIEETPKDPVTGFKNTTGFRAA